MPFFAVASSSSSAPVPGASTGSQVTTTPPGDTFNPMEVEEQEAHEIMMAYSPGGESPAPGVTLTEDIVDATGGLQRTSRAEAKSLGDVIIWRQKRSSSLGSGANAKLTVSFAGDNLNQSPDESAAPSPFGSGSNDESKESSGTKVSAGSASIEDQPGNSVTPGDAYDCKSILNELPTTCPNGLQYNKELWEKKFQLAQLRCYQLLDFNGQSETHARVLTHLNGLVLILEGYSSYPTTASCCSWTSTTRT